MGKLNKSLIYICIFFAFVTKPCFADSISLQSILEKAKQNSDDLKVSNIEIEISKAAAKQQKADYFPTIFTSMGVDYTNDLTNGRASFTSVGDQLLSTNTRFQNLISLGTSYNVFDFGIRKRKLDIAKAEIDLNKIVYEKTLRELKLELIDLYTKALIDYKSLQTKKDIISLYEELYGMKKRLYDAGKISKIELITQQILLARAKNEITDNQKDLINDLSEITFYTNQEYNPETTQLLDFQDENSGIINVSDKKSKPLEVLVYDIQISQKQKELQILTRENLPSVKMYSKYGWYGSNPTDYGTAFKDLKSTSGSIGLSASMPLFDGFKNNAQKKQAKLEIEKLKAQQSKSLKEYEKRQRKYSTFISMYNKETEDFKFILGFFNDKIKMNERLTEQKLIDKTKNKEEKAELLSQKLEFEKILINLTSSIESLKILSTSDL